MPQREAKEETILAGKYRLDEVIGTGGMGTVYRGTHIVLHRPVAVKLLHVEGSGAGLAERFLREAQVAAAIRHPNVVDIIDFGTASDGRPFMVMEYLEGESLWDRMLRKAPLSEVEQIEIMAQVLLGLDAVHRAGILHRDLKPANIFLSPHDDGTLYARLLDFGISYSVDPESKLRRGRFGTDDRMIIGTPQYLSPEQAEGRPDLDARADVWAIGVILYELLTDGQLPYDDENPGAVLFKVMSGGHVALPQLRPDLPDVARVVEAALSHDREARPASARDFRRQLLAAAGVAADLSGSYARLRLSSSGILTAVGRDSERRLRAERPTEPQLDMPPGPALGASRVWIGVGAVLLLAALGIAGYWLQSGTSERASMPPARSGDGPSAITAHTGPLAPAPRLDTTPVIEAPAEPEPTPEIAASVPAEVETERAVTDRTRAPSEARARTTAPAEETPPADETPRTGIVRDLDF